MNAAEALHAACAAGVTVTLDGEGLLLEASAEPPQVLIDALVRHKRSILALLRPDREGALGERPSSPVELADTWTEAGNEYTAIIKHNGGAPCAWAEALAQLDPCKPPADIPPRRWLTFIDDCGRFLDGGWAERASILGWGPLNLFGCDRERPFARVDHMGLLWLVNGRKIIELHRDQAIIETERGARQSYRRRPVEVGRVVLAWELVE
jgi:hypothetical protein